MSPNAALYDQDLYAWAQAQAAVLDALGSHSAAAVRIRFVTVQLR